MLASNDKASKYSLKKPLRSGSVSSQQLNKTNLICIKIRNLQRITVQSSINQRGLWENDTTETLDHVTRVGLLLLGNYLTNRLVYVIYRP